MSQRQNQSATYLPVVLITGCSSGIGSALAHLFYAQENFRVVVTARMKSLDLLKSTYLENERFLIRSLDITDDEQISDLVSEIYQRWRAIDVVINNAGICYRSVLEHMDEESELHQLKTNYLGPMSLTRAVLPTMREKGAGKIINISSVSGMVAMPTMGSYSASKGALESASEALWYEMKPFGVSVSIVQPGFVDSQSFRNVYFSKKAKLSAALLGPYSLYYSSIAPFIARLMKLSNATPEKIAKRILHTVQKKNPPLWVPVTYDAHLFNALKRFLPHSFFYNLMFRLLPKSSQWSEKYPHLKGKVSETRSTEASFPIEGQSTEPRPTEHDHFGP